MSVATEHFYSRTQTGNAGAVGIGKGFLAWFPAGPGAAAVGLSLLVAVTVESFWPLLLGPVFLMGAVCLMGFRSLWPANSETPVSREQGRFEVLGRFLTGVASFGREHESAAAALESEIRAGEPQSVIDELQARIGKAGKKYAENAYVIGRQYMRLGHYGEAREWLRRAGRKSGSFSILDELAERHLGVCNERLLAEGDALFGTGDYQGARERYARLSQGLGDRDGKGLAIFLRSACVYCMLGDFEPAHQAVLQALKYDHETDDALALLDLLQGLSKPESQGGPVPEGRKRIEMRLAHRVADVMDGLRA